MTTQSVAATLQTSQGVALTFQNHSVTDLSQTELTSGGFNVVAGQSAGTYGDGMTVTHGLVTGGDNLLYAYIANSDGSINCILPITRVVGAQAGVMKLVKPVRLIPGMTLQVKSAATGSAHTAASVYCSDGTCHIFDGQSGSSGAVSELVSIINDASIGSVLTGKTIVALMNSSTTDWDVAESAGNPFIALLAGNGRTKAFWVQQFPVYQQPGYQEYNVQVDLNDTMKIDTDTS